MDTSAKIDSGGSSVERASRRMRTLAEKLAIVEEASQPGASVALVARKHGLNANLLFGWLRLHRRGLLAGQRHGTTAPLLPVKIGTPTLTPTQRTPLPAERKRGRRSGGEDYAPQSLVELVLPDGSRLRLYGEAQRSVLERILQQLSPR
jgi:transposase